MPRTTQDHNLWIPGIIVKVVTGLLSYHVETENGIEIRRDADQLHLRSLGTPTQLTPISGKKRTYLMMILIFQYKLLYKLILLITVSTF